MPMQQLRTFAPKTPFLDFICDGCNKSLGSHWQYRPEKLADVFSLTSQGRKPDGVLYCHRDQIGRAVEYHQRSLRRTMEPGYIHK